MRNALIALLMAGASRCIGQGLNTTSKVDLYVHVSSVYGDAAGGLERRQFHVTANGRELPFMLTGVQPPSTPAASGTLQTHLLLVLRNSFQDAGVKDLPAALRPLFAAGWRVGVIDERGAATVEAHSEAELLAGLTTPKPQGSLLSAALDDLRSGSGRRVVFFMSGVPSPSDAAILRASRLVDAMVYRVGGDPRPQHWVGAAPDQPFTEFNGDGTAMIASVVVPGVQQTHRYLPAGDPIEEPRLPDAIREALLDGLGYYDLQVQLPENVRAVNVKVDLFDAERGRYLVTVVPHAEGSAPPTVTIVRRR